MKYLNIIILPGFLVRTRDLAHRLRVRAAFLLILLTFITGCVTRYEYDNYTITVRDSIIRENVLNAPGTGEENGTVYPSSRTTRLTRESLSYDSTYERHYPDFLRYGGIEFAGLITGSSNPGLGAGL